jgi:hypothetical protein
MKKPSKKRIDEVAAKLRDVFHNVPRANPFETSPCRRDWRRVAAFVLTELQTAPPLQAAPAVKSCKVVRGKKVCK